MYKHVLPEYSQTLLFSLAKNKSFIDFYLAGGTALALQIGHRESIDLDFFTQESFNAQLINEIGRNDYLVTIQRNNSIECIIDNTKVQFLRWAFPITQEFTVEQEVRMLDPIDIGLYKLLALQGRQAKKDIIDLYYIHTTIIPFVELLQLFSTHYPQEKVNIVDSVKMMYDEEAIAATVMPKLYEQAVPFDTMLSIVRSEVEAFICGKVLKP